jgi:thioredoxin-dependent peroxiredoxin
MERVKVGDMAPDFEAFDDEGRKVGLADFRGKRVVLYFYPKDDTSGCTTQACSLRDAYPDFEAQNAVVLGVSPDDANSHARFRKKHGLPFNLLIDGDHTLAEAYGVWAEKSMYGRKYMGIVRSHFIIDQDGRVLDARYKISPKESAVSALEALRERV